jgi:hypothetical protein
MDSFRQSIIHQIKGASNPAEVAIIIEDSLQRLKIKKINGHIIQRFILCVGLSLHRETTEVLSTKTLENIKVPLFSSKKNFINPLYE